MRSLVSAFLIGMMTPFTAACSGSVDVGADDCSFGPDACPQPDPCGGAPGCERVWTGGNEGEHGILSLDVGADGRVVVTGWYRGSMYFGGRSFEGGEAHFVASLHPDGHLEWLLPLEGTYPQVNSVSVHDDGSIFVAAHGGGTLKIGGVTIESNENSSVDAVVVALTSAGAVKYVRRFGAPFAEDRALAVASHADGSVSIGGYFQEELQIGTSAFQAVGWYDAFIVRLDPDGNVVWARTFGSHGHDGVHFVATNDTDDLVVGGVYSGPIELGDHTLAGSGNTPFVAVFDSEGEVRFAHSIGGLPGCCGSASGVFRSTNAVVAATVGTGGLSPDDAVPPEVHLDVLKVHELDSGVVLDTWGIGALASTAQVRALAIDEADDVVIVGEFTNTINIGPSTHEGAADGSHDLWVVKRHPNGEVAWSRHYGGEGHARASDVAIGPDGAIYVGGFFKGALLGSEKSAPTPWLSSSGYGMFLLKIAP